MPCRSPASRIGAYLGARIAPDLLRGGSPYAPLVALAGAVLGGMILQSLAGILGGTLRATIAAVPGLRAVDSAAGLLLGAAAGVVLCWAIGAVLLYLPGQSDLRESVQKSAILSRINDEFPPRAPARDARAGRSDRRPPRAACHRCAARTPRLHGTLTSFARLTSVVRVTGVACGLGVEGSGWIVRPGVVITNAHVVAGIERPQVDRRDGEAFASTVVAFDPGNDLAVLRVPGLPGRPLPMVDPDKGLAVAVLGYPENGPLVRIPGRLGGTGKALSRDAYGRGPVTREVTAIRAFVRPGSSGGPAVDARGRVRTVVFARRAGEEGGYGIPTDLVQSVLAHVRARPVASTPCVS